MHAMMEKADDAGLAATFLGINQGKSFLKSAHEKSQQAQKEVAHLQGLVDHVQKCETFMGSMPQSTSVDFDWGLALDLGKGIHTALIEATSRSQTISSKQIISDAKKKMGEFVATISKAFVLGPLKVWLKETMCQWSQHQTIPDLPKADLAVWRCLSECKFLSGEPAELCHCAMNSCGIMHQTVETIQSSKTADVTKSASLLAKLAEDVTRFKMNYWAKLQKFVLVDPDTDGFFTAVHDQLVTKNLNTAVSKHLSSVKKSLSTIMSKASQGKAELKKETIQSLKRV